MTGISAAGNSLCDEARNPAAAVRIMRVVKSPAYKPARPTRADRLRREASNCLTIAVAQRDLAFCAELIDEAVRLSRRARELAATSAAV